MVGTNGIEMETTCADGVEKNIGTEVLPTGDAVISHENDELMEQGERMSSSEKMEQGDRENMAFRFDQDLNLDDTEHAGSTVEIERPHPVTLRYDVSFVVDDQIDKTTKKALLNRAVGEATPGDLVAVMGPSGAGKTTLLRILAGRVGRYIGKVLYNDKSHADHTSNIRNLLCFVQQEDLFIPSMTPREHLAFSARLRVDQGVSDEDKMRRVEALLAELGLTKCADTPIGGVGSLVSGRISGGEKKRLSLATELLSNPSVIFADEPTSGLDSFMAEAVIAKLGRLARAGHTVVATIHQPSSYIFSAFSRVHLLAHGKTAFSGRTSEAVDYFASINMPIPPLYNPADYYLRLLSLPEQRKSAVMEWERGKTRPLLEIEGCEFDSNDMDTSEQQNNQAPSNVQLALVKREYAASWFTQLSQLMARTILTYRRDATLGRVRLAQAFVLGILVGLIFLQKGDSPIEQQQVQSVNGALFFAVLNQGVLGTLGVLQVFPLEKPVFLRETSANAYSPFAYFMGKTLAEGPFQVIFPAIFATILYFILGFGSDNGAAEYFTFVLFIVLTAVAAVSLGYLVGAIVPSVGTALAVGPLVLMPLIIFGGLLINVDDIDPWFEWLSYLSFIRYGYEGVMITIWENEPLGPTILDQFGWDVDNKWRNVGCLCALIVGLRTIALFFLKLQAVDKTKLQ